MKVKKELKGNITEDQLKQLKKEISESLSRDRHRLLIDQPFIGNVAMRFDLMPVRDRRCLTACTDNGKTIYFNCDFYLSLNPQERAFVLAHEIWHSLNLTFARRQTRDAELWNIASDMEINNILAESANHSSYSPPKNLMFPPPKLKGKSAETIYDWLLKQQEKNNLNNALSKMAQPDSMDGDDNSDSSSGLSGSRKKSKSGGSGDKQEKRDTSKDGKNTGKLEGQFDKHTYEDDTEDGDGEGKDGDGKDGKCKGPTDRWGEMGYDDDFKPSVPADAAERMREAAIAAATAYQREHGSLPAGVEELIGKLARPEISWREHLASFVHSVPGSTRRWLPPNRRHVYNDMYFQSRRNETVKIGVFIDSSGSTTGELPKFFAELAGLVDSFQSYEIHLIFCDAAVDHYQMYDQNNPLDLSVADNCKSYGGGGTDLTPPFEYVEENDIDIDCAIYMTDGYADSPSCPKPRFPVLWLLTKGGTDEAVKKWGKIIWFKESAWE